MTLFLSLPFGQGYMMGSTFCSVISKFTRVRIVLNVEALNVPIYYEWWLIVIYIWFNNDILHCYNTIHCLIKLHQQP